MRILPVATLTAAALASAAVALAPPSQAGSPLTFAELRNDLSGCTGTVESPFVETITMDLSNTSTILPVGCVAVLDLGSSNVRAYSVLIRPGKQLTVRGTSGTLTVATTDGNEPGIETTGASLVVTGGTITATAGSGAAGIGSRANGAAAGDVTVTGGTVNATGGGGGAGIGNGNGAGGATSHFTQSGGTVVAQGGRCGAGVGGGADSPGLLVAVDGGTLAASGEGVGPGIGGGCGTPADNGSLTVSGGAVTATGGSEGGAGVGPGGPTGGAGAAAGPAVTVTGGTVVATGFVSGAGIGGNSGSDGGAVVITGGEVTAAAGESGSAIGGGVFGSVFGSLQVSGTGLLRLPTQSLTLFDSNPAGPEVVVAGDGRITGSAGATPTYASVNGAGQIQNDGVIVLPAANVTGGEVTVSHRHYDVTFDAGAGTPAADTPTEPVAVYAGSFVAGGRAFPSAPTPPAGTTFAGWVATGADSVKHLLTADSDLTILGDAPGVTGNDALAVTAVAAYRSTAVRPTLALVGGKTVAVGSRHTFQGKARAGVTVGLYAGSTKVGTAKAAANGAFKVTAKVTRSGGYTARAEGLASSAVAVKAIKLTFKISGPRPIRAGVHKLSGAAPAGRAVVLLVDGKTFDRTTARANNTYSFTVDIAGKARFQIQSDGVKTAAVVVNAQRSSA